MSQSPTSKPDPALLDAIPEIPRNKRLRGKEAVEFWARAVKAYGGGHSIRAICARSGRSYGVVHQNLMARGVVLRSPGGYRGNGHAKKQPSNGGPRCPGTHERGQAG
ncbi:helix-turn-helix domain-containing protein [Streptomyces noursei]|uniref:helix-turn-helix domain-containing protein n=1 Tax=Streptomyces noursei TaxID=1971 RepID=UPI0035D66B65